MEASYFPIIHENKMLTRGNFDLNSGQNCTDSINQRLKQMMLHQELVFMRQLYELHRLYRVQIAMTDGFIQKGMNDHNMHKGGISSISIRQNKLSECSMAEFTRFANFSSQQEWQSLPGFIQRPLDLQLSADEFISRSADHLLGKGILGDSLNESFKSRDSYGLKVLDADDLNLTLTIGDVGKKRRFHRSWLGKKISISTEIIDLEDPNLVFSKSSAHVEQTSSFPPIISNGTQFTTSLMDVNSICQKLAPDSGFPAQMMSADFHCNDKNSETHASDNLDLNVVNLEDSSCFSTERAPNASRTSLSCLTPASWKKLKANQCPETLDVPQQLDLNVDLTVTYGSKICFIDLDSDSDSGENLHSRRSNMKLESVGSLSKASIDLARDKGMADTITTEENFTRYSSRNLKEPSESDCIEHLSSSAKTMQSCIKCRDLNISASDEIKRDHDMAYSESTESNVQCTDDMVQKAAELLIQISSQRREIASQDEENDKTECSSDSYAAMVLMAKETDPNDDYCVSSNAFVVDEIVKKENRYKLKRGSRMKDFQKDILPGLCILSRHEIREDIKTIESVIRSREYKKMRSKFGNEGDWCRLTRSKSKRSKARCSRR